MHGPASSDGVQADNGLLQRLYNLLPTSL